MHRLIRLHPSVIDLAKKRLFERPVSGIVQIKMHPMLCAVQNLHEQFAVSVPTHTSQIPILFEISAIDFHVTPGSAIVHPQCDPLGRSARKRISQLLQRRSADVQNREHAHRALVLFIIGQFLPVRRREQSTADAELVTAYARAVERSIVGYRHADGVPTFYIIDASVFFKIRRLRIGRHR